MQSITAAMTVEAFPRRMRTAFWHAGDARAGERESDLRRRSLKVLVELHVGQGRHRSNAAPSPQ